MDNDIWKVFSEETQELCDDLEQSILEYEKGRRSENLHKAYQHCHTIKGSLAIVGFETLESVVHRTEDLFHECRTKPYTRVSEFVHIVLFVTDLVRQAILMESETFLDEETVDDFTGRLDVDFYEAVDEEALPHEAELVVRKESERSFLRIDSGRLDELMDLTGELLTVGDSFRQMAADSGSGEFVNKTSLLLNLIEQLSEKTLMMRMIPLSSVMNRFKRTVHDLAKETGKQLVLEISGERTEMDKTIAEKIVEPMIHLIKNCVDHGIGTAEERAALGKEPEGRISIAARQESDSIIITIEDDGNGLDYDNILSRARSMPDWNGSELEEDLAALIFEPGFSTARELSTISGRGMGMSAVRDSITALRGSLRVLSEKGEGIRFEMSFPLSLALVDGLLIMMEENYYIIPSDLVLECLALEPGQVDSSMTTASITWNGSVLPLLNLKRIMAMEGEALNVVVVRTRNGSSVGLICDTIVNTIQTVVKPLSGLFKNESWLQGSSVLGSGEPVLILNVDGLLDRFRV